MNTSLTTDEEIKRPVTLLPLALELAVKAHGTVINKDDTPYILHPLRLMMQCQNEDEQIVAILHDTLEDTELTMDEIREAGLAVNTHGFTIDILDALDCLTKRDEEKDDYEAFIRRIATNPLAIRVKLLDLYDNIDVTRLPELGDWELKRTAKYHKAIQFLKEAQRSHSDAWAYPA